MKDVWERVEGLEAIVDDLHEKSEEFDKLIPILLEYNRLRDEEWDFEERHGNRDMWDYDTIVEHDGLLADISAKRAEIRDILRKVTGDLNLQF
jgi:hypothetical protein